MKRTLTTIIAVGLLLGLSDMASAQQCCMPDVGDSPQAGRLIKGIYAGTLVLGSAPFLLVGGIAVWFKRRLAPPEA